jgi:Pyruvate/2-oxoacid:ferredoxin oxidoreductase delta subunit
MSKHADIVKLLDIPKIVIPYLNLIYTEDQLDLTAAIKNKLLSKEEIQTILGKPVEALLDNAYKAAVVDKVIDEKIIKYKITSLANRLDKMATFEADKWHSIKSEDRTKIADWLFNDFLEAKRNISLEKIAENGNKILPLNEAIDYLNTVENDIYVMPCDCKAITGNCSFDKNVCMSMGSGLNSSSDRGHGKKLTKEEAVELLKHADKEGLIHSVEKGAICNCCSCCCYPLRASKELGLQGKWPLVTYVAVMDKDKCINCGICTKRCQLQVFEKIDGVIHMDNSKCVGCGLCVNTCPKKALHLEKL